MSARKSLYTIHIHPMSGSFEWRLYNADMTAHLIGGVCSSYAAAQRESREALRVRIEYPENFTHEKAANVMTHAAAQN